MRASAAVCDSLCKPRTLGVALWVWRDSWDLKGTGYCAGGSHSCLNSLAFPSLPVSNVAGNELLSFTVTLEDHMLMSAGERNGVDGGPTRVPSHPLHTLHLAHSEGG